MVTKKSIGTTNYMPEKVLVYVFYITLIINRHLSTFFLLSLKVKFLVVWRGWFKYDDKHFTYDKDDMLQREYGDGGGAAFVLVKKYMCALYLYKDRGYSKDLVYL